MFASIFNAKMNYIDISSVVTNQPLHSPGLQLSQNKQEWFPVFVKILTTWFCFVLFMLYILAPGLLLKASAKLITRKASEQERGEREEEELRTYSITES